MDYRKDYRPEEGICYHYLSDKFFEHQVWSGEELGIMSKEEAASARDTGKFSTTVRGVNNIYIRVKG